MIVFIEGPRASGKTFLINSFFEQNKNPNVIYYKFAFAKYIDQLGMRDQEDGPGVHYFSIANVLTILELNRTLLKDKIVVFDRSIFSAYVWSIYRQRMDKARLIDEFSKILSGELYQDCTLLYLNRSQEPIIDRGEKDYFGNFENYSAESELFEEILTTFKSQTTDSTRGNSFIRFTNQFNQDSVRVFSALLNHIQES